MDENPYQGNYVIYGTPELKEIRRATSIGGSLKVDFMGEENDVTVLDLPNLHTINGDLILRDTPVTEIRMPALRKVTGDILILGNPYLDCRKISFLSFTEPHAEGAAQIMFMEAKVEIEVGGMTEILNNGAKTKA